MDYHRPLNESTSNPSVAIALIMFPGVGHKTRQDFSAAPVLINPGGPGGSGVYFTILAAEDLRRVIGDEHDIVGFDPRAVGGTTPEADCFAFPSQASGELSEEDILRGHFNRMQWQITGDGVGIVNSSDNAIELLDQRARAVAALCKKRDDIDGANSILRHSSTTNVARDMLSIVDAWSDWIGDENRHRPFHQLKNQLLFWGGSYGTLLGNTFAALYPERVGRMLLDAVLDATYYVAPVWANSMSDTDAVLNAFFRYCREAQSACAFYRSGDTENDLEARFQDMMRKIEARKGFAIVHPESNQPALVTASHIRLQLFSGLYQPVRLFPRSAAVLDALYRDDEEALLLNIPIPSLEQQPSLFCPSDGDGPLTDLTIFDEGQANLIIKCSDKRYNMNESIPSLRILLDSMSKKTAWADVWMNSQLGCESWDIPLSDPPLPWNPDIPFSSPEAIINVSHPILFTSSTLDPVCPFSSALKMARRFQGSGIIQQLSEGHGISAVTSRCTIELIREYFTSGSVPETKLSQDGKGEEFWTRCEVDEKPFQPYQSSEWLRSMQGTNLESNTLKALGGRMDAWKNLQRIFASERRTGF
jgi:pimeloyl-ACP methyl ester carboxylesterase